MVSHVCSEGGVRWRICLCIFLSVSVLEASLDSGLKFRQFRNENASGTMAAQPSSTHLQCPRKCMSLLSPTRVRSQAPANFRCVWLVAPSVRPPAATRTAAFPDVLPFTACQCRCRRVGSFYKWVTQQKWLGRSGIKHSTKAEIWTIHWFLPPLKVSIKVLPYNPSHRQCWAETCG